MTWLTHREMEQFMEDFTPDASRYYGAACRTRSDINENLQDSAPCERCLKTIIDLD